MVAELCLTFVDILLFGTAFRLVIGNVQLFVGYVYFLGTKCRGPLLEVLHTAVEHLLEAFFLNRSNFLKPLETGPPVG